MTEARWFANYDEGVPTSLEPYPARTLIDYLREAANKWPDRAALLFKGATVTYTLNAYDVLQLVTDTDGIDVECDPLTGWCRKESDLTGTVITSTKPIGLYGGAACNQGKSLYCFQE